MARRPQPSSVRRAALALALLAIAVLAPGTRADCRVRLDIDASQSLLILTGKNALSNDATPNSPPLASDATFNDTVPRALTGTLYAVSASLAACPAASDQAGWLAAWPTFLLSSNPTAAAYAPPLVLYPSLQLGQTLLGKGLKTYDYNVSDMAINLLAGPFAAAGPAQAQVQANFTAGWVNTTLASGWLKTQNSVTGNRFDNLENITANASGVATSLAFQVDKGVSTLVLTLPSLSLTYATIGHIVFLRSNWTSYANYTLTARVTAKAVLDCPSYCGDFGRCVAQPGNGTACECDCGWTAEGGQCILPYGFCARNGGSTLVLPPASASPAPSPSPSPSPSPFPGGSCGAFNASVSSVNGQCPTGYDWDSFGVLCNPCPSGFSGSGCALCQSDAACKSSLASSTATCSLSTLYRPRSAAKHYACDLLDAGVVGILGSTLDFTCSTTKPRSSTGAVDVGVSGGLVNTGSSPINNSPYCTLSFRLSGMPRDASVICTGWQCAFSVNSSKVDCPVIKCECPKGCSNADGSITEATFTNLQSAVRISCGREAGMADTSADGQGRTGCKIELTGLPITAIPASCATRECLDPVNGTVLVTAEASEPKAPLAVAPIIAWVPAMLLTLISLAAAAAALAFARRAGPGTPGTPEPRLRNPLAPPPPPTAAGAGKAGPVAEGTEEGQSHRPGSGSGSGLGPAAGNGTGADAMEGKLGLGAVPEPDPRAAALPGQLMTPPPSSPREAPAAPAAAVVATTGGSSEPLTPALGRHPGSTDRAAGFWPSDYPNGTNGVNGNGNGLAVVAGAGAVAALAQGGAEGKATVRELSWHRLTLATTPKRSYLRPWHVHPAVTLLTDVSGRARAGEVLGVLGPSGSGKTSLLSVLTGLTQPGLHWSLGGAVALDGHPVAAPRHLATLVGHVPQHDLLARSLTVAECVAASAALRSSARDTARGRAHAESRVASVLSDLGILHLAHRVVWPGGGAAQTAGGASAGAGGSGGSLSGGERLRVAAALELVSEPPLLLLDEPLSGLDSATARATMAVLRAVAAGGGSSCPRIVIVSMHQPSPALFGSLDCVCLMAGGRVAYFGPPAAAGAAVAAAGLAARAGGAPASEVPIADHLLDLVAEPETMERLVTSHAKRYGGGGGVSDWPSSLSGSGSGAGADSVATPSGAAAVDAEATAPKLAEAEAGAAALRASAADTAYIRRLIQERRGGPQAEAGGAGARLASRFRRFWLEFGVLTWRGALDMLRNPSLTALHVLVSAGLGLLVGAVFSNTDLNVSGAQNRVGAIFLSVMLLACFATSAVDGVYPERPVADRDMLRRSHGVLPYMAAKLILDGVLLRVLPAWAYALPFYWLMGLRPQAAAFFTFMGAFSTMSALSGAACIALSFVFASPGKTVLVLNLLLLICALFSGFLANKDSIVVWLRWIVYLSPIRFCWEALVINELKPLVLYFDSPDLPQGLPAVRGSLFLSLLGVDSTMLNTDLVVLGCMYAIVALFALGFAYLRLAWLRGRWD